jgi:hypothetical protein
LPFRTWAADPDKSGEKRPSSRKLQAPEQKSQWHRHQQGPRRTLTDSPDLQHNPVPSNATEIPIRNRKTNMTINIKQKHLPEFQMWAYAGAYKPLPLVKDTCKNPHKY